MSRRSKRRKRMRSEERDAIAVSMPRRMPPPVRSDFSSLADLIEIEDNRTWTPVPFHSPVSVFLKADANVNVGRKRNVQFAYNARDIFRFERPEHLARCVRRKQRREVLFALRRTRSGRGRPKRRNYWSDVSCK